MRPRRGRPDPYAVGKPCSAATNPPRLGMAGQTCHGRETSSEAEVNVREVPERRRRPQRRRAPTPSSLPRPAAPSAGARGRARRTPSRRTRRRRTSRAMQCASTRARRPEAEDEDAVERDRQRAEKREPSRPAMHAVHLRPRDGHEPLELPEDARAGEHLHDGEHDGGGREPRLARDRRREDRRDDVGVRRGDAGESIAVERDPTGYDRRVSTPDTGLASATHRRRAARALRGRLGHGCSRSPSSTPPSPAPPSGAGDARRRGTAAESSSSQKCAPCHGRQAQGGVGPRLAGASITLAAAKAQIDNGGGIMPARLVTGGREDDVLAYLERSSPAVEPG